MNYWLICAILVLGVGAEEKKFCEENSQNFPTTVCFKLGCTTAIKNHIKHELNAAFKYLYMGALFGQLGVERPGMAHFLLDSASEERSHAILMMDYLNMRGIKNSRKYSFASSTLWKIENKHFAEDTLKNVTIEAGLQEAMRMEIEVTKKINKIVGNCAGDFHAADVFTNPILEEQHTGMRKLQGAIQALKDLEKGQTTDEGKSFAEYVFDQRLLKGEL